MRKDSPDLVELGLWPRDALRLVELLHEAQRGPTSPDHSEELAWCLWGTLAELEHRAGAACGGDPAGGSHAERELRATADELRRMLEEALPEQTEELGELLAAGVHPPERGPALAVEWRRRLELVAALALELGVLAAHVGLLPHLPDIRRGHKVIGGAKKAHEAVHGTREEKERRWSLYQRVVDAVRAENPRISSAELWRLARRRLKEEGVIVSDRTLRRRCPDPACPHPRRKN